MQLKSLSNNIMRLSIAYVVGVLCCFEGGVVLMGGGGRLASGGESWRLSCKRIEGQIRFPSASTRLTNEPTLLLAYVRPPRY